MSRSRTIRIEFYANWRRGATASTQSVTVLVGGTRVSGLKLDSRSIPVSSADVDVETLKDAIAEFEQSKA